MVSPHRSRRSRSREHRRRRSSRSRERHHRRKRSESKEIYIIEERPGVRATHRSRSRSPRNSKSHKDHRNGKDKNKNAPEAEIIYFGQRSAKKSDKVPSLPNNIAMDPQALAEQEAMRKLMGFATFDTTKNKHVEGNLEISECVNKAKKRKYRQYMNRKGGFNRPLDFVA